MANLGAKLRAAVSGMERGDRDLSDELKAVRESLRGAGPDGVISESMSNAPPSERAQLAVETIVLRTGRPVLSIVRDEARLVLGQADSQVWKSRLERASGHITAAARAVGRIELKHHPMFEWVGTGWLVDRDVVVTNRHVASEFGRRADEEFVFRPGVGGEPMEASIDFLEEVDRRESSELRLERILHIEDEQGPDLAFLRVVPLDGRVLAAPVRLSAAQAESGHQVAVIGYPARDSRIPEQDLMREIFGDVYDKKRLAPGQITQAEAATVLHDCSTLGGNSGSLVMSLETGEAFGLHFAGRFLEANYAVPAAIVRERLRSMGTARSRVTSRAPMPSRVEVGVAPRGTPTAMSAGRAGTTVASVSCVIPVRVTVDIGAPAAMSSGPFVGKPLQADPRDDRDDDAILVEARPEDYANRAGYNPEFLKRGMEVPLPEVTRTTGDVLSFRGDGADEHVLRYEHFSVVMSRSRRLCILSAVNIDGRQSRKEKRAAWRQDPRILPSEQIIRECYGNPPKFSRGHMTRREDPVWGTPTVASRGNSDSMHVTNVVPQMQPFNAPIWLGLEDYALDHAREDDMKIAVLTGPFLSPRDPEMFGVAIPRDFWKVIAFIHDDTRELCATGYRMSQEKFLREEEFIFGQHETTQVSIASIEDETGLSFGPLDGADPLHRMPEARPAALTDFREIRFLAAR